MVPLRDQPLGLRRAARQEIRLCMGEEGGQDRLWRRVPLVHRRGVPNLARRQSSRTRLCSIGRAGRYVGRRGNSHIQLATLSEVHLRTHSATRARSPRSNYRSAIYIFEDSQRQEAELAIARFADEAGKAVHTLVLPFRSFRASDERYQNYYRTDPSRPFCRRYIDPKLEHIRRYFSELALPRSAQAE